MPAPSLPTLYDYESAYESAFVNYLANVNASWQLLTPTTIANATSGTDFLQTPRVMVKFDLAGTGIQKEWSNGVEYYADRTGILTLLAVSRRNDPTQNHGLLRGSLRTAMLERSAAFNANTVPWFQTVDVTEGSSQQSYDRENEELITQLSYHLTFFIPSTSFP